MTILSASDLTPNKVSEIALDAEKIYFERGGKTKRDWDFCMDMAILNAGYEIKPFHAWAKKYM